MSSNVGVENLLGSYIRFLKGRNSNLRKDNKSDFRRVSPAAPEDLYPTHTEKQPTGSLLNSVTVSASGHVRPRPRCSRGRSKVALHTSQAGRCSRREGSSCWGNWASGMYQRQASPCQPPSSQGWLLFRAQVGFPHL